MRASLRMIVGAVPVCCLLIAGCGGAGDDLRVTASEEKPADALRARPRVQGRWRVVYRARDYRAATRTATWIIVPSCEQWACTFAVRSSRGFTFDAFRLDDVTSDYTFTARDRLPCGTRAGTVADPHGYAVTRRFTLRVTAFATTTGERRVATRMRGTDASTFRTTEHALAAGCRGAPAETDRVLAVQLAP